MTPNEISIRAPLQSGMSIKVQDARVRSWTEKQASRGLFFRGKEVGRCTFTCEPNGKLDVFCALSGDASDLHRLVQAGLINEAVVVLSAREVLSTKEADGSIRQSASNCSVFGVELQPMPKTADAYRSAAAIVGMAHAEKYQCDRAATTADVNGDELAALLGDGAGDAATDDGDLGDLL